MNMIKKFNNEAIASFDLTVFGQEIFLFENNIAYVLLPFHKLGYYDDIKGLSHNYNLGYVIFEDVNKYKIRKCQYKKDGSQDINSKVAYEVSVNDVENSDYNNFEISDIGLNPIGLNWQSLKIKCRLIHLAYDFTSPDCSPTNYNDISKDQLVKSFLLTQNLENLYTLVNEIDNIE
jgi:hypothetical protein